MFGLNVCIALRVKCVYSLAVLIFGAHADVFFGLAQAVLVRERADENCGYVYDTSGGVCRLRGLRDFHHVLLYGSRVACTEREAKYRT